MNNYNANNSSAQKIKLVRPRKVPILPTRSSQPMLPAGHGLGILEAGAGLKGNLLIAAAVCLIVAGISYLKSENNLVARFLDNRLAQKEAAYDSSEFDEIMNQFTQSLNTPLVNPNVAGADNNLTGDSDLSSAGQNLPQNGGVLGETVNSAKGTEMNNKNLPNNAQSPQSVPKLAPDKLPFLPRGNP